MVNTFHTPRIGKKCRDFSTLFQLSVYLTFLLIVKEHPAISEKFKDCKALDQVTTPVIYMQQVFFVQGMNQVSQMCNFVGIK